MPDTIRRADYYYVIAPDKPGEGARIFGALRDAGVSLLAVHAFPSARKSQIDVVPPAGGPFSGPPRNARRKFRRPRRGSLTEVADRVAPRPPRRYRPAAAGFTVI